MLCLFEPFPSHSLYFSPDSPVNVKGNFFRDAKYPTASMELILVYWTKNNLNLEIFSKAGLAGYCGNKTTWIRLKNKLKNRFYRQHNSFYMIRSLTISWQWFLLLFRCSIAIQKFDILKLKILTNPK